MGDFLPPDGQWRTGIAKWRPRRLAVVLRRQ